MKNLDLDGGEIYAIPLFIKYGTDMERFSKKYHQDNNGIYAFCRIISEEMGNSYLIEVFSKIGGLNTSLEEIIKSPRLLNPVAITNLGILKKRWIEVYKQKDYDKFEDSGYCDIKLVMGGSKNLQLWQNRNTKPISEEEAEKHEKFIFWRASHLERRIREALGIQEP